MDVLENYTSDQLGNLLTWFRTNLAIPDKCNRSRSKGSWDKGTAGISWFKGDASDAIQRSYELITLLRENGYAIDTIRTERVG
ncbi:hypothetical protein [uncultured Tateyamaria sp.]|uniref:hypothetical protein n=1 Tax=uncultured Tateyamaria sp. TaxID=455651 RepID=UPI00261508E5|nr:hypothetical protein [uncultured Tateyamaria sp.]